jgi:subtilisin family serine protease
MIKPNLIIRKFSQYLFLTFVVYCTNYFVPVLIPDSNINRDQRIQIKAGRISGADFVEGEVLVKFKPRVSRHAVDAIADSNLSTVARRYKALTKVDSREYAHLKSRHRTTLQMIQALKKNPQVEAVSPNFILHVDSTIPDDENFSYLWGLHNTAQMGGPPDIDINAPEAWDIITGSSSVIVGIIDTGIDYNHPDLIPNMWINPGEVVDGVDNDGNGYVDDIHGINAITASGDPMDDHSHGTHCAGTIGAVGNNNLGVVGVNWNVKLIGTKFLDATGYGTDADAIDCINYLIDLKTTSGQNIVAANASFGGGNYDPVMESAINAMGTAGIVFCAAAGNDWMDNDATPYYPSSYACSNIISVTAVDWMGWQNFNFGATSVDLGAPGVDILSTISAVYYPQAGDIFFDDMESGSSNWTTGGINNSWAITADQEIFEDPAFPVPSPPNFWSDSPGTLYLPDTDSWLMIASDIDLSGYVGQNLYLGFGSAMLLEPYYPVDHGYVEVSGDGGNTWQSLMDFAQYGYYWYIPWYFLIPDSFKTPNFRFRFHLVTDFSDEYDGWLIDDVGIGTASYYGYGFKSGTSMAAPHVTGAVALLASQHPSETVTERINRILNNVTPLPSLIGTCVTEGMLNLFQAICLPGIPKNPSPSDAATDISVNTLLDWDDSISANSYDVYFGTSSPPPFAANVTSSSYDPGTLAANTTYHWRIVSKNPYGEISGQDWQFVTSACPTPSVPTNPNPPNQASDLTTDVDLDWDDSGGADSYDVYFGTSSPPPFAATVAISFYDPGALNSGTQYYWKIAAKNTCGETSGPEWSFTTEFVTLPVILPVFDGHDFDGNGTSDISLYRPADGMWHIKDGTSQQWGAPGDIPVQGNYDLDTTTEIAIFRPSNGLWYISGISTSQWGASSDIPVPHDYSGDGVTDIAVWRPSDGVWYINGVGDYQWGQAGDYPVPGDYNGDGADEVAVWRPAEGAWYISGVGYYQWGSLGDIPVPADYNGDGKTDLAVFRETTGMWYIQYMGGGTAVIPWGMAGDIPVPGDYNGDGTTEVAIWRPSNGLWYLYGNGTYQWGNSSDIPLVR